jgi:hypothetical protein
MRRILVAGLGWALGWAATAQADDGAWGSQALPRNEAVAVAGPAATLGAPRAATLGRPRPMTPAELAAAGNPPLTTAAFTTVAPYVVRAQLPDSRPMPPGAGTGSQAQPPGGSDKPQEAPQPRALEPAPVGPAIPAVPVESPPPPVLTPIPAPDYGSPDCCGPLEVNPLLGGPSGAGGPASRWWVSGEYLFWWAKNSRLPPLVTTDIGPTPVNLTGTAGSLASPTTAVVVGNQGSFPDQRSGLRVSAGWWLDPCDLWGVDASFFILPRVSRNFTATQATAPNGFLARPFFSANDLIQAAEGVVAPGLTLLGGVAVSTHSELWGADANLRRNLVTGCYGRLDFLTGFRFLTLTEDLQIAEAAVANPASTSPSVIFDRSLLVDRFSTENRFYGGQVGLAGETRWGRWFMNGTAKVALGTMNQQSDIAGGLLFTPRGAPPTQVNETIGGLLALPSNIGHRDQNKFAVVPEVGINFGFNVTERLRLFTGYSFLYASSVLRPADQIDPVLNVNQITGFPPSPNNPLVVRPIAPMKATDFWAQGINFGLEFNW